MFDRPNTFCGVLIFNIRPASTISGRSAIIRIKVLKLRYGKQ